MLDGQSGVTNDTAEGKGVDRVMTWDRQDARAVRHDDMLSLTSKVNPAFCRARTASRWLTPGIFDTIRQRLQSRESLRREAALRLRQDIHESRP